MPIHIKHSATIFTLMSVLFFQGAGKDVVASNDVDSFQLVVTAVGSTRFDDSQPIKRKTISITKIFFNFYNPFYS